MQSDDRPLSPRAALEALLEYARDTMPDELDGTLDVWTEAQKALAHDEPAERLNAAAPDLLDALQDLVARDRAEALASGFEDDEMSWLEDARRALAKAAPAQAETPDDQEQTHTLRR